MAIVDGRTIIDDAEAVTNWTNAAGSTTGIGLNTDTFAQGSASISDKVSNSVDGLLYNHGINTWSDGDHVYIWYRFLFGSLNTRALGGITIRAAAASSPGSNYREVFVDGSDTYNGEWKLAVVSIDRLLGVPDAVAGTLTSAANIAYIGAVFDVTANVGGNNDNVAVDAIYRLPATTAGIRVEGEDTGGTPFTWADIATFSEDNGLGVADRVDGVVELATPIQFGASGAFYATTFDSSNDVIAWRANTFIEDDLYQLTAIAGTDTGTGLTAQTRVKAGSKLGIGVDAVGVGGWNISTGGPKWAFYVVDPEVVDFQLYGCQFSGARDSELNHPAVEVVSSTFSNCGSFAVEEGFYLGPTVLNSFFTDSPGPKPQVKLIGNPASAQFDGNTFANMDWFALELSVGDPAGKDYDLRNISFINNGTDRDILLTHIEDDIQVNVLGGDTPGVTNGSVLTITSTGACDIFASVVTLDDVDQTTPVGGQDFDTAPAAGQLGTGGVNIDANATCLAAAAAAVGFREDPLAFLNDFSDVQVVDTFNSNAALGASAVTTNTNGSTGGFAILNTSVATPTVRNVFFDSATGEYEMDNGALIQKEILPAASTQPAFIDPDFRPYARTLNGTVLSFGYGAPDPTDAGERLMCLAISLITDTDGNSPISSVQWGASTPINLDSRFDQVDDNGAQEARAALYTLDSADFEQGTFDVNVSVTLTITVVDESNTPIENARVAIITPAAAEGPDETQLMNELTNASGVATEIISFSGDLAVSVRVRKGSSTDTPKYQPINSNQTITSDGLTVTITMTEDPINTA